MNIFLDIANEPFVIQADTVPMQKVDYTKDGRRKQMHNAMRYITEIAKAFNAFTKILRSNNKNEFIYLKECDALGNLRSKPSKETVKNFEKILPIVIEMALSINDKRILEVLNILQSKQHVDVYKDYLNSLIVVNPVSIPIAVNPLGKSNRKIKDITLEKTEVVRAFTDKLYDELSIQDLDCSMLSNCLYKLSKKDMSILSMFKNFLYTGVLNNDEISMFKNLLYKGTLSNETCNC